MNPKLLTIILLTLSSLSFAQDISFIELGSEPAYCRQFSYQNGGGVVYASAIGGVGDLSYSWEELATGITFSGTVWGGRNPGNYQITVTDDIGTERIETLSLDSINVVANFHAFSDGLTEVPGGYVGFAPDTIGFINTSSGFSNPIDPTADTLFFWNFDHPGDDWNIVNSINTRYKGYYFGGEFDVCLVAFNKNSCKDTVCKTIGLFGSLIGLDEADDSKIVSIIPQSDGQSILINQSGFDSELVLTLYSVSGQIITRENLIDTHSNLPFEQPKGIYFYEISGINGERLKTGKFNF